MKRLVAALLVLSSVPAFAADLPVKADAYTSLPPVYNWSGFYAGLHAGYAATKATVTDTTGGVPFGPFGYEPDGGLAGVQGGYNYQRGQFVVGLEGDFGYVGLRGSSIIGSSVAVAHQDLTLSSGWYGDITGRVGYAVMPALLVYGKGGYAYFNTDARQTTTNPGYQTTGTGGMSGWVAGLGAEWLFLRNLSVKIEYLHYDFGGHNGMQTSLTDPPVGFQYLNSTSLTMDTAKVGLNYHF